VIKWFALAAVLLAAVLSFKAAYASNGRLIYEIVVTNPGSKSQGWHGILYADTGKAMQVKPGTRVRTVAGEFEAVPQREAWVPYGMIHVDTLTWLKEHGADLIHENEEWAYKLYVTGEGTRSQGIRGELLRGRGIMKTETVGERVKTPMGPFDWHTNPHGWGSHDWIHISWSRKGVQQ
jgi:hypothetical protein